MAMVYTKFYLLLVLGIASSSVMAKPPEGSNPDSDTARWYKSLLNPISKGSCCDLADCRPTELRQSPDNAGDWQAYISKAVFGSNAPDQWITIPNELILQHVDNPTGRVVICWVNEKVYCAVLPSLF